MLPKCIQRWQQSYLILSNTETYYLLKIATKLLIIDGVICDMIKGNESLFLPRFLITLKCFILMQTPLQLDIWLQSYEEFVNAKNNIKQRNLNTVFANTSKTIWPTSDSFLLIMSHIAIYSNNIIMVIVFIR